jgi:hypothetical protein
MQETHKSILTLNITKYCNYIITKLAGELSLRNYYQMTVLHVSLAAKAHQTEGPLLHENEV